MKLLTLYVLLSQLLCSYLSQPSFSNSMLPVSNNSSNNQPQHFAGGSTNNQSNNQVNLLPVNGQCPILDLPVCGANGRTYQNECFMRTDGAAKAYDGWCRQGAPKADEKEYKYVAEFPTKLVRDAANGFLAAETPFIGCACSNVFNPVCGGNGITYANFCRASCKNVIAVSYGECGVFQVMPQKTNTCACDFNSSSVCGNNGITYESSCVARCFNTSGMSPGVCAQPCGCAPYYKPVCGSNGKNYINTCALDCAQVAKYSDGVCSNDSKCGECYGSIQRMCGMDNKTYDNSCYMNCAGVKKRHDGHCVERADFLIDASFNSNGAVISVCNCSTNYLPVCATNGVTFINECEMNCAGATKKANWACDSNANAEPPCQRNSKRLGYSPVCGTDNLTYYNREMINCKQGIHVQYEGECKPISYDWCKSGDKFEPVCGVDGKTYLNDDVLRCVGVAKYCDGTCELNGSGWIRGPNQLAVSGLPVPKPGQKNFVGKYDEKVNSQWYNTLWGTSAGKWTCSKELSDEGIKKTCQPETDIKYLLIQRQEASKAGCMVLMPRCNNISKFIMPYDKTTFHGFKGFLPDRKYLEDVLINSYTGDALQKVSIDVILETAFTPGKFDGNAASSTEGVSIFVALNDTNQNKDQIKANVITRNTSAIPAEHKQLMAKDPTLFYLYFYLMVSNDVVTADTSITANYTVKDAMFYIAESVWKLDLNVVSGQANNVNASFVMNQNFNGNTKNNQMSAGASF